MFQQILLNTLITASIYSLIAISYVVIYRVVRFFHFAHAIVFTFGAYFTFLFKDWIGLSIYLAIVIAILFSSLLGCLMEISIYRPLRHKNAPAIIFLLASLGIYIILQNTISIIFGNDIKSLRNGVVREGIKVFGAYITPIQIVIICASILFLILMVLLLQKAKIGKGMRAVASDPELANISGIESDKVILWTFAIGSALAGIAGILVSLDVDMTPTMGMNALMMGIVAVIIGGVGSIPGVAFGALLLAFAQNFGVWKISSQWQDAIAFIILFIFLLFRPQGFLGKKIKKATV